MSMVFRTDITLDNARIVTEEERKRIEAYFQKHMEVLLLLSPFSSCPVVFSLVDNSETTES